MEKVVILDQVMFIQKLYKNLLLNRVAGQLSLGSYPFCKFPKKLNYYEYDFLQWSKKIK